MNMNEIGCYCPSLLTNSQSVSVSVSVSGVYCCLVVAFVVARWLRVVAGGCGWLRRESLEPGAPRVLGAVRSHCDEP